MKSAKFPYHTPARHERINKYAECFHRRQLRFFARQESIQNSSWLACDNGTAAFV
jgi:hypothetical protein